MDRRSFLRLVSAGTIAMFSPGLFGRLVRRPNILIVLADDMGYSDLGCMGGEARTQNIDKLRHDGVLFTNAYNNAKCAPSRAALMTGLYNQRVGAHRSAGDIGQGGGVCVAELLKAAGYATILAGKWHIKPDPLECGFERHYGSLMSPVYFAPIYETGRGGIQEDGRTIEVDDSWYSTVAYTDFAIRAIKQEAVETGKPFFLFLSCHAPHWPLQALREDIARYRGRYANGTDALRKARYKRLAELGIVDPEVWSLPELEPGVPEWEELTKAQQEIMATKLAIHAAMVDRLDREVGRLIDWLKASGRFEDTLIFVLSDNGASPEHGMFGKTDSLSRPGRQPGIDEMGSVHTYLSAGTLGAAAVNSPLRKYKTTLYEGGCCTPLIVHWPGRIAKPGSISRQVCHVLDIVPTCLEAAGISYPDRFTGRKLHRLEGRSLLGALTGKPVEPRRLFWHYKQGRVVRDGDWKLVGKVAIGARKGGQWELYDLRNDRSETRNVADKYPEKVRELAALWEQWNEDTQAVKGYEAYTQRKKSP